MTGTESARNEHGERGSLARLRVTGRALCLSSYALLLSWLSGCAAFSPVRGVPINRVADAQCISVRNYEQTIDLSLLRQIPPREHIVDARDILAIYIEGILGDTDKPLPTSQPLGPHVRATVGYPLEVRGDGTISLPYVPPIPVAGLTVPQVEQRIRETYTIQKPLLQPGQDRILVGLHQPRTFRVLVLRQEAGQRRTAESPFENTDLQQEKRGTGHVLTLPAFENDVLHALAQTGGLPGLDAQNAIYIIRQRVSTVPPHWNHGQPAAVSAPPLWPTYSAQPAVPQPAGVPVFPMPVPHAEIGHSIHNLRDTRDREANIFTATEPEAVPPSLQEQAWPPRTKANDPSPEYAYPDGPQQPYQFRGQSPSEHSLAGYLQHQSPGWSMPPAVQTYAAAGAQIIRIPLRTAPGQPLPFSPADVILEDGDVIFIEARDDEFFYSSGLLGGGRFRLPRDRDLDLVEAISLIEGEGRAARPGKSIGGASILNQDVSVGASRVVIHRKLPDDTRVALQVNLYDILKNPNEPILIQPEDRIYLRYAPWEVPFAFLERHLLEGAVIGAASSLTFGN